VNELNPGDPSSAYQTAIVCRLGPICGALALCAGLAGPAHAGLFSDNEAHAKIAQQQQIIEQLQAQQTSSEARFARLEQQNQNLLDLFNQLEALNQEVRRLRGQIEELQYGIETTQKRQKDFYLDLDSRIKRLEGRAEGADAGRPGGPDESRPTAAAAAADPAQENRAYEAAFELFRTGNYQGAISGFQNFLKAYPRSPLAPSAQYWVGNGYYALKDYKAAIASQQQLIAAYPESPKIPDAWLNIASSQLDLGETAAAKKTLKDLAAKYPASEAAEKAKRRLASLK
jgi:tol-pal system protein YbgF